VALAIRTGVPPDAWLEDTRALVTAVELFNEIDRKRR
jgi:hypothetical protein